MSEREVPADPADPLGLDALRAQEAAYRAKEAALRAEAKDALTGATACCGAADALAELIRARQAYEAAASPHEPE